MTSSSVPSISADVLVEVVNNEVFDYVCRSGRPDKPDSADVVGLQGLGSLAEIYDMQFLFHDIEETKPMLVFLVERGLAEAAG